MDDPAGCLGGSSKSLCANSSETGAFGECWLGEHFGGLFGLSVSKLIHIEKFLIRLSKPPSLLKSSIRPE